MTVSTTARSVTYTGNDSTTIWTFTFPVLVASHMAVKVIDTVTGAVSDIAPANFTLAGVGDDAGGTVTYPLVGAPLTTTQKITLIRTVPITQDLDIQNQEGFFPEVVEDQLDLIVMMIQQLEGDVSKVISSPIFDSDLLNLELPAAADRANKYLFFNSDGSVGVTGTAPSVHYQGAFPTVSLPTTRLGGAPLQAGDLAFDTTISRLVVWDGVSWVTAVDTSGGVADGDKGDITVTSSGTVWTIDNDVVTYAKMQDISATARLLGRITAGAGDTEELTGTQATTLLDVFTSVLKGLVPASGGGTTNFLRADGTFAAPTATSSFDSQLLHVRDEKISGSHGGTFTSGAWQTRVLNTVVTNEITGASLASNQITLPAGTFYIEADAPALNVGGHKSRLFNITDTADVIIGTSEFTNVSTTPRSKVRGRFVLAASKVLELQHRSQTTQTTNGFGSASSFGVVEVYAEVRIWKVG